MSYTFSRRDFMKYTALTAVAVASAGMFTGCSGNPNQPTAVFNNADASVTFGGTSGGFLGIGASHDKHTLLVDGTSYNSTTLTCAFAHTPVTEGTSSASKYYRIRVDTEDGMKYYVGGDEGGTVKVKALYEASPIEIGKNSTLPFKNTVTVTGLDTTGATAVYIQYFPRHNALNNDTDSYSDVFATWNITSLFNL